MQKEKVRIFALARELDMESKDLLAICRQHGIDVKNQLSTIEPELAEQIKQLAKKGPAASAPGAPAKPATLPQQAQKTIVNLDSRRPRPAGTKPADTPAAGTEAPAPQETAQPGEQVPAAKSEPAAPTSPVAPVLPTMQSRVPVLSGKPPMLGSTSKPPAAAPAAKPPETPKPVETPAPAKKPEPAPAARPAASGAVPNLGGSRPGTAGSPRPTTPTTGTGGTSRSDRLRQPPRPTHRTGVPMPPPPMKAPPKPEAPRPEVGGVRKISDIPDALKGRGPINVQNILDHHKEASRAVTTAAPEVEEEEDDRNKKGAKGGPKKPGELAGRADRHKERQARQEKRKIGGTILKVTTSTDLLDDDEPTRARSPKSRIRQLRRGQLPTEKRKGKVPIMLPISVRSFCEAAGIPAKTVLAKLMANNIPNLNINSPLDPELAETIAIEQGIELEIKKPFDAEQEAIEEIVLKQDNPEDLKPRAPIVTIMGHVDHGKTSLLDKIRGSRVVDTEAGGITQVIRAWRVDHKGHPITFLDTPGHEAFTKMRARGANVTDIAVIVVAADDGVMPQTEEAIAHAKAAGVSTIVAINKVDLPNANIKKTEQQLYSLNVLPDDMGGDTPFVRTSAATGKGIDDLLESINLVAELHELKANPNRPATGTCLEAKLSEGEGVMATLLVRNGTLHRGDVILCGAASGRVRAMYDDLGRPIEEAGPSVPVRITGLNEVPNADDPFLVMDDLAEAAEIADRRKKRMQEAALAPKRTISLETLSEAKITELKVILKAEARGSIEAIRKELEKLKHEEVAVRVLHTAIGAITESDVRLAEASGAIILGFNVVPDDQALREAERSGVQIREYDIIYKLTDDVRAALEGKLKPREEVVHLGRAIVRETFKISRVGTIAGCYVTSGTIERSAKVRVIRAGVVIYPPTDRTASLESLKRFKEDVREVREGFECGMKIAGYDDIKVDDVIEAYRVELVQRTLS